MITIIVTIVAVVVIIVHLLCGANAPESPAHSGDPRRERSNAYRGCQNMWTDADVIDIVEITIGGHDVDQL